MPVAGLEFSPGLRPGFSDKLLEINDCCMSCVQSNRFYKVEGLVPTPDPSRRGNIFRHDFESSALKIVAIDWFM
jgi:hypothetical protein